MAARLPCRRTPGCDQLRSLTLFIAILALLISYVSFAGTLNPRDGLIHRLFTIGYFKDTTCREFSDFVLAQNGLPKLGMSEPVRGIRESTDRHGEDSNPPEFIDSITQSQKPRVYSRIAASSGVSNNWRMTIEREQEGIHSRVTYAFQVVDHDNKGSCALEDFNLTVTRGPASKSYSKTMTLNDCLDLFMLPTPEGILPMSFDMKVLIRLRETCATGMHYSLQGKKLAAQVARSFF